jgi:diguanylate cyclase (GGDEF)-like protein/PAS domain S-box-containing protein
LAGVLCVEHIGCQRLWSEQEKRFVVSIADLVAQRLVYEDARRNAIFYQQLSAMQETILDSANCSIISTDVHGIIQTYNSTAHRMLGYEPDEVVGKITPQQIHDSQEVMQRAQTLSVELGELIQPGFEVFVAKARRGIIEEREWTYVHKDGSRFPVLLSVTPLTDDKGMINGYLGIATDISEQVQSRNALIEKELRYRVLFENARDSILLLSKGVFVDCNEATLRIFGCTREQIIEQTPSSFSPEFQPDGRLSQDKAREKIDRAMTGETQFFEWQHVRYDGTPFDVEVSLNVITLNENIMLYAVVHEITERKLAEQELLKSRQALLDKNASLKVIYELSNKLHGSLEIDAIVRETLGVIRGLSREPGIAIYLLNLEVEPPRLKLAASHGFDEKMQRAGTWLNMQGSLSGFALEQGRIIVSSHIGNEDKADPVVKKLLAASDMNVAVVVPLMYQLKQLGCINLVYPQSVDITTFDFETLESIGKTVSLALSNAIHMRDMKKMALHDSLTGLSNRLHLHQTLEPSLQPSKGSEKYSALLLIDLDRFKEINDTLGHHVGDLVLQQIGPRISKEFASKNLFLARLGGDEFTIFLPDTSSSEVDAFVHQLRETLRTPYHIDDMILELDASIGVACYPKDGEDSHSLLRSADVAMYEAKRRGCGYLIYDLSMDQHSPERLIIMAELSGAIREGQLQLHYQPKINLVDNSVSGFEALVRWQHPTMGLLYPDKFIPMAEVGEAIHFLTVDVLEQALKQQQVWLQQGQNYTVAINLSARNLIDKRFFQSLQILLKKYQSPADMLELEITETALMQDPEGAVDLLKKIASLGVKLSIDDFGTGYSSLSYLHRLSIDALKIDFVFVRDMLQNEQDEIIVRSTISLAHNLKLKVVAEGVEDEATLLRLKDMGCDLAQGYHIKKPTDWQNLMPWLEGR